MAANIENTLIHKSELDDVLAELSTAYSTLVALFRLPEKFLSQDTVGAEDILKCAREAVPADGARLSLLDENTSELQIETAVGVLPGLVAVGCHETNMPVNVIENNSLSIWNMELEERIPEEIIENFGHVESVICVPIACNGSKYGVLSMWNRQGWGFSSRDRDFLVSLSNLAGASYHNERMLREQIDKQRMERELKVGREIQAGLLPADSPDIPGLKVVARSLPAYEVGGDYYDYFSIPGGRWVLVIGDACDKGVPAALVVSEARSLIRSASRFCDSPSEILNHVNVQMESDMRSSGFFVTAIVAVYDPHDNSLVLSSAGHPHPVLTKADGAAPEFLITTNGNPLGMFRDGHFVDMSIHLNSGDSLVIYTDGFECPPSMRDGGDAETLMKNYISSNLRAGTEELLESLFDEAENTRKGAKRHDDMTALLLKAI